MTKLLEKALKRVQALPQEQQDALARQILAELEDEKGHSRQYPSAALHRPIKQSE